MSRNVQIFCRIKPCDSEVEKLTGDDIHLESLNSDPSASKSKLLHLPKAVYSVDNAFFECNQEHIFKETLSMMLDDLFNGFNCTLFTFGQSGSGKTHTVIGGEGDDRGLLPRGIEAILGRIDKESASFSQFILKFSAVEIYHEKLYDLLSDQNLKSLNSASLAIREDSDGSIFIENIREISITTLAEFNQQLAIALKRRKTGVHKLNDCSSRSHFCCLVDLIQYKASDPTCSSKPMTLRSRLSVIDLAGSEMAKKSEAKGQRFEEAKFINKSLSALSKVIAALAQRFDALSTSTPIENRHIPFRDSKLTRLLQNSLSGNSRIAIILTVSQQKAHLAETISTLKFGERARLIKTCPQINRNVGDSEAGNSCSKTTELEGTIEMLKQQMLALNQVITELRLDRPSCTENAEMGCPVASVCSICCGLMNGPVDATVALALEGSDQVDQTPATRSHLLSVNSPVRGVCDSEEEKPGVDGDESCDDLLETASEDSQVFDRCRICGLDSGETEELRATTREDLGSFFSCDGNCGGKFHVRCVGVVGEGGQFTLPEGEWFCQDCTVQLSDMAIAREKEKISTQEEVQVEKGGSDNQGEVTDSRLPAIQHTTPSHSLNRGKEVLIYSQLVQSLQQKYHQMRKERNRILSHFQNELKMQQQFTLLKDHKFEKLALQAMTLQEENESLQNQLLESQKETQSLRHQLLLLQRERSRSSTSTAFKSASASSSVDFMVDHRLVTEPTPTRPREKTEESSGWVSLADSQELRHLLRDVSALQNNESEVLPSTAEPAPSQPQTGLDPLRQCRGSDDVPSKIPKPWLKRSSSQRQPSLPLHLPEKEKELEPSRFINPMKNRLSELLDLVQEEKHAVREIRHRFHHSPPQSQ